MSWTKKRHEEAKARCEAATPGPWDVNEPRTVRPSHTNHSMTGTAFSHHEDATFVAHARTDLPDALAEIERLNRELDVKYAEIARMKHIVNGAQTLEEAWKATDKDYLNGGDA